MRLLWRTDVHLSDRSPRSRSDDWTNTCLDKLRQVYEIAKHRKCDAIIDGGDFFDIKSPSQNSHHMISRYCHLHAEYQIPVYANVGNHDCVYGDYTYLPQQPLEVLFSTGVFNRLYDGHMFVTPEVKLVGIPYHGVKYQFDRFRSITKDNPTQKLIVFCHLLASPSGGMMFDQEDVIPYGMLKGLCPDADAFFFGHWHQDQGITYLQGGPTIVNVGSLSRGALTQDNLDRIPKVVLLDTDTWTFEEICLDVAASKDVFRLDLKVLGDVRKMVMDDFVENLKKALSTDQGKDLRAVIESIEGLDVKVRETALQYLEKNP